MSRLKKYHLPHDGYKWRSDGRDKKWPQTTKIYYKCISVEGCPAKLHFFPHTKEIQYVGEHSHPKAHTHGAEEQVVRVPVATSPVASSPVAISVVASVPCAISIPPEVYQRPVRQSARRQRSCVDAMAFLDDESEDNEDEEEEDEEEAYVPANYHSDSTSPISSDNESSPGRSRAGSVGERSRAAEERPLLNIEEDVAIFLGAMQSEQKKKDATSPSPISRKRKANDEGSPYMSEADDDDGGPPNTDNKCPHCGKVFQNRSTFVHHWRVVVQREQQRDCPICHEIISTWYNMKRHLGNVHKWSPQQIENERGRITAPPSPQLGEPQPQQQHLQLPSQQQQRRSKKIKSEETAAGEAKQRVEVKMEVVSAEEEEESSEAEDSEAAKKSIRSRRARKAAAAAAQVTCGCTSSSSSSPSPSSPTSATAASSASSTERTGRMEGMLERLLGLYEQDREERRAKCRTESEERSSDPTRQQHQDVSTSIGASSTPRVKRELQQIKEQELRLREERLEMRERELEQREREQLARLQMREEAMLLRERELELLVRERTLAMAHPTTAALTSPSQNLLK